MVKKKKILWLCSYPLTETSRRSTGTWLGPMIEALLENESVELYNVAFGRVKEFTRSDIKNLTQWVIPHETPDKKGLPSSRTIRFIKELECEIKPDLIHVWGTENFWGMLVARKILKTPAVLDIQGIISEIAKVYTGGLSNKELVRCIGLKEILLPNRFLYFTQLDFARRGIFEYFVIRSFQNISVQSNWVRSHIELIHPGARIFPTGIVLRKEFYEARPWNVKSTDNPVIFTSSSSSIPYKGLHVLFRALAILKKKFPTIRLRIGGGIQESKYRFLRRGYSVWLMKEARKLGIVDSIEWLGALDAGEIVTELQQANAVVIPSYIESFCLALAESMIVGVPSVASYAGAIPELGRHNESVLFFPVGDAVTCARQVEKVLTDKVMAATVSNNARAVIFDKNNKEKIVARQLQIYNQIIAGEIKSTEIKVAEQSPVNPEHY